MLASVATLFFGPAIAQEASAVAPLAGRELPVGPQVVQGGVAFGNPAPNRLLITQSTQRAIVNFQSFDIASGAGVRIDQPGPLAAFLGRVTGQDASILAGSLSANGQFLLVNPNGIAITNGATIDTGAFVGSTLDIADADFLSGNLTFRRAGRAATVVNQGTVTASQGAALVGSGVVNEGVVEARLGRIGLGAGDLLTVDFSGDKFLQVALPVTDAEGLVDALGRPLSALVTAGGTARAEGGRIYLSAQGARELMLGAVRVDGSLIATTVREGPGGRVRLGNVAIDGGGSDLVQVTGRIDASGGAGLDGGTIEVAGGFLGLGGTINASGGVNGGSVTLRAERTLSLADQIAAMGRTGAGGRLTYTAGGAVTEIAGAVNNASGGLHGGVITVTATGDLATSGAYLASGFLGYGGRVDLTGGSVRLLSTRIDASGGAMGGLVRVGGAFQGGAADRTARADYTSHEGRFGLLPTLAAARSTFVNDGVTIDVASSRGQGGSAVIWSDDLTTMLGSVLATGRRGGGWVEVSGKETLRYVDLTRIETGVGGGLLLDPRDIIIGDFPQAQAWQYAGIIGTGFGSPDRDIGSTLEANDQFGFSTSLNAAGDRLAVGAATDDGFGNTATDSGSVRLFTFTDAGFAGGALAATIGRGYTGGNNIDLGAALGSNDQFGGSVSLNAAGDRLAVGAYFDDGSSNGFTDSGSVRLFTFTNTRFAGGVLAATIGRGYTGGSNLDLGAALEGGDTFGRSVSLNAAGDRLAVGAPIDAGATNTVPYSGSVRLFTFTNTSFGGGALAATIGRGYTGGNNIDLGATLENSDQFGVSVSLNAAGDRLAVGAPFDAGSGNGFSLSGSVRLFTFTNTSFGGGALTATIGRGYTGGNNLDLGAALEAFDLFGISVSLNAAGDRLAAGAGIEDGFGNAVSDSGSVRLFTFTNTSFGGGALAATIGRGYTGGNNIDLGAALEAGDRMGWSVSLNAAGDRLAVGAPVEDGFGNGFTDSGSVRLFTFTNTSFGGGALAATLGRGYGGGSNLDLGVALEANDQFGFSTSLNAAGDRLAVGAPLDDGFGNGFTDSGSVRLFTFTNTSFGGGALTATLGRGYAGGNNLDLGADLEANDLFGHSVSLNAVGDRLAVGSPNDDGFGSSVDFFGSVRLFTFANGSFGGGALAATIGRGYTGGANLDLGAALDSGDKFGASVSLNAAGDRLAVGAPGDAGFGNAFGVSGSVRLFTFTNASFGGGSLAATLGRSYSGGANLDLGAALEANDQFGTSVSLSAAGDRLAVGANNDDGFGNAFADSGSVRLFTFSNSSFSGGALAAIIGRGYTGGSNIDLGAVLENSDQFGVSVSLNAAGDRLAVGAAGDDGFANAFFNSGSARLFTFTGASFGGGALAATLGRGYGGGNNLDLGATLVANDALGSVSLNAAGDRLAVGAWGDAGFGDVFANSGSVRLFTFTNTSFAGGSLAATLGRGYPVGNNLDLGAALESSDQFGFSVSLNAAGDGLAVGAFGDDGLGNAFTNSGSVRLFTFTNTSFGGGALAATIGRGYTGGNNLDLGVALEANDWFGFSVSLNAAGDRLAVGATGDDGSANAFTNSGSVRLFTFTNTSFAGGALAATFGRGYSGGSNLDLGADLGTFDQFSASVSLNAAGDRLAVGAAGDDGFGNGYSDSGSVRLFTFTNTSFGGGALAATLGRGYVGGDNLDLDAALEASDVFGFSVSLNGAGDRLAVGAYGDDGFGNVVTNSGSVRLFTFTNTSFGGGALAATIGRGYTGGNNIDLGADLDASDWFGVSASLNGPGNRLAVGAPNDDGFSNLVSDSGSVRLFTFTNTSFGGGALSATLGAGYVGTGNLDLYGLGLVGGFGSAVAFDAAGERLALGSPVFGSNTGAVHLFTSTLLPAGSLAFATNSTGTSYVPVAGLAAALASGTNITLEASNDITLISALNVGGATAGTLTLTSGRSILLNAPMTTANGSVNLTANSGGSDLATVNANRQAGAAVITMGAGATLNAGTGAVSITLAPGAGLTTPTSGSVTLNSITARTIAVSNAGPTTGSNLVLNPGTVLAASGPGRAIDLQARTGTFTNNAGAGAFSLTGGGVYGVFSDTPDNTLEGVTGFTRRYNIADAAAFAAYAPAGANVIAYRIAPVLTVTADSLSRIYGNANPTLTYGVTGFLTGDTLANSTTGAASLSTTATASTGVGSAPITVALGMLASEVGYQFTLVNGTLGITPRPITLTADALSRVYGEANPALTYTVGGSGLVNGDTVTGALATTATPSTGVGTVAITQGSLAANANYAVTYVGANLTITPRPLLLTANALSRVYGEANPALTYTVGGSGLVNGDTVTGALATTATPSTGVGTVAITQGSLAANANYAVTYVGANLTITPRPLLLTANALSRVYGEANPALTYTVGGSGLVNGDVLTGALATTATPSTGVGTVAITQGSLAAGANYAVTYVGANLTITPRPLLLTANALSRVYGEANPALTYTVGGSGLVNGDVLTGALATTATPSTGVGTVAITQGSLAAGANYAVTYVGANLTITPRPLLLTANALSRVYGEANPALTYTVGGSGLVNGDVLTGALATTATPSTGVGTVAITQGSLAANANYAVTYVGANLTITPRPLLLTANALSRVYGEANPALTYTVGGSGLVNGDVLTGALATTATPSTGVGTVAITQGSLAAGANYAVTYVGANLTITPRPITITADAVRRFVGQPDPALTYRVTTGALQFADTLSGRLARMAGEAPGAYPILIGSVGNPNYQIAFIGADLTIIGLGPDLIPASQLPGTGPAPGPGGGASGSAPALQGSAVIDGAAGVGDATERPAVGAVAGACVAAAAGVCLPPE
ncbi:MBG domain-containing protein [Phenylobacterium parvum]|nr:MBG domain-containing protein [Phenylobacterium parvum]